MKRLFTILSLATALFSGIQLFAQEDQFYIDAQLRTRGEYRAGYLEPAQTITQPSAFINERARIGIGYNNKWLTLKFSGQHTGVWGQTAQNPVNNGDFSLNEAWGQVNFGADRGFYIKFGRQTLVYDDERILGGLDWHIAGRSHDAFKFGYASADKKHQFDVFGAFNQNALKTYGGTYFAAGGQPYKTMASAWYHFDSKTDNPFAFSLLFMNLGFEKGTETDPSQRFMQTMGTYITYKPGMMALEGSFYYQTGKTALDKSISAWMFALKATAKFSKTFNAYAGLDWLSGNTDGDKYTAFDPLYGTHHKFYGLIDYWYVNRSAAAPKCGLIDPYLGLSYSPAKTFDIALTGHAFMGASNAGLSTLKMGDYKGTEVDLQLTWKPIKYFTIMGGYSGLYATTGKSQNWLWLQLNLNPRIFSTKK